MTTWRSAQILTDQSYPANIGSISRNRSHWIPKS